MVTSSLARTSSENLAGAAPSRARRGRVAWKAYLYILPAFVVFLLFLGIPVFQTVSYSFYNWNGLSAATWAGMSNYANLFQDPKLRDAFLHTGVLILFYSVIPVAVALALTAIVSRANKMKGMSFFRTVLFLPQVIASAVVATTWVAIYAPDGMLNQALRAVGLGSLAHVWLGEFGTALMSVGFVGTWLNIGLCLVLFLSGVANIQPELFEAARLDGAGAIREFTGVTLPALRGQIAVALTLTVVSALKSFDVIYITTRGGPGSSTTVPAFEAYSRAFITGQVGLAASIAVVLTVVIIIATVIISRLQPKDVA